MDIGFLMRGLVIGFSIAAPVGPVGVLCIRRTLAEGRTAGMVSGLGAATAHAFYGFLAGTCLTVMTNSLPNQQLQVRFIAGLLLCYVGIRIFSKRPAEPAIGVSRDSLLVFYVSTFFLALTNPMTIIPFVAVSAGLSAMHASGIFVCPKILILGIFVGSSVWWLVLSSTIGMLRSRFSGSALRWVNKITGTIIMGFGIHTILLPLM
jgi:threonine/homoserine/homoserine lactone efflux protein